MGRYYCRFLLSIGLLLTAAGCASISTTDEVRVETPDVFELHTGTVEIGDLGVSYLASETSIFKSTSSYQHVLFPDALPGLPNETKTIVNEPATAMNLAPESTEEISAKKTLGSDLQDVWNKFCNGKPLTNVEQAHVNSHAVPAQWLANCYPMK